MKYYGTGLTSAGHNIFDMSGDYMNSEGINFSQLPFHPEELTNNLPNGQVVFYQGGGFTVLGISGGCYDKRPGTKSIFWLKESLSKEEIVNRIKENKLAMEIINAMPFEVNL